MKIILKIIRKFVPELTQYCFEKWCFFTFPQDKRLKIVGVKPQKSTNRALTRNHDDHCGFR